MKSEESCDDGYDLFCADGLDHLASLLSKAADALRETKPAPKAPKGKKKTFHSMSVSMGNNQWSPVSAALSKAWDYACKNPDSVLEIVVRKPVKP